jgi:3'(2'), 5'-bisphosphate nucleotidase
VTLKDDQSPLTEADKASHTIIARELSQTAFSASPDKPSTCLPVLSEEGKNIPYSERHAWEYFWLIDPLDGTKEFIKKNGEFTVNIAYPSYTTSSRCYLHSRDRSFLFRSTRVRLIYYAT